MSDIAAAQQKKSRGSYWLLYTGAFAVLMTVILAPFWATGRTLISSGDSACQFYPAVVYAGEWYRQVLGNFLHGEFVLPTFDLNVVLGEDAYSMLTYYNLGNPLFFLAALVPSRWMPLLFQLSIPVQYYLAGAAFSLYCFYMKRDRWATLTGAIVYVSCGYMFKVGAMYVDFLAPLIYLPLLLIGFEAVLQHRSVIPMILASWYAGLNKVYFFYMCGIFLVLYGLIRGLNLYGLRRWLQWFQACLKAVGALLLGLVLAAPFLLPSVMCFFQSGRSGGTAMPGEAFLPSVQRLYALLTGSWMVTEGPGRNNISLCAIAILAVVLLAVRLRRRWPALCAGALLAGGMYLFLFTDYLMNLFSASYDRWVFLLAFVWALAVVYVFPEMLQLARRDRLLLCGTGLVLIACALLGGAPSAGVLAGIGAMTATLLVLLAVQNMHRGAPVLLCGAVLANAALIGLWHYADFGDGFASNGYEMDHVRQSVQSAYSSFEQLAGQTNQNYRVNNIPPEVNSSMLERYRGINGYWSLLNGNMLKGLQEMGVISPGWHVELSDKSQLVQALLGVRCWITRDAPPEELLSGWQPAGQQGEYSLYENPGALPIAGYVYPEVISQQQYEALDAVQKQQMALHAIALEELPEGMPLADPEQLAAPLDWQMTPENVVYQDGALNLTWWSGRAVLEFSAPADTRLMLCFRDAAALQEGISVSAQCGNVTRRHIFAEEPETAVLDLGVSGEERSQLVLEFAAAQNFEQECDVQIGQILLYALPEAQLQSDLEVLGSTVMQDVTMDASCISGSVSLEKPGVLCVAIPCSPGWTATVDGEKTEIRQGNTMFMALPLEAGRHSVVLRYRTPGLAAGWVLFVCGAAVFAVICRAEQKQKSKAQPSGANS